MNREHVLQSLLPGLVAVRDTMNTNSTSPCGDCGGTNYENWTEKQSHEALTAAISRVEKVLGWIDRGRIDAECETNLHSA